MSGLAGEVSLVMGASRRIGAAIARDQSDRELRARVGLPEGDYA